MALFRKFFYRKPPEALLEISERVFVFDCCFTADVMEEHEYKIYMEGIADNLCQYFPDASFMVFNFREGGTQSQIANILSQYEMTVIDYPRWYESCPLLTVEMIHHFLKSSESWLLLGHNNVLLMHCEHGAWPVLAFMLAALLIYRKQYAGEMRTLDMIYKQAPHELLQMMTPLNPLPSQLRYLQYISRRNVGSEWPPLDRALTLDCIILRGIPNMDGEGGCCPIFRIYGQDPFMAADRTTKVLFSTPRGSKTVRYYKQTNCELATIDIHCHIQGDVVLECISLDSDLEHEEMMFRVMFNTAFIRSNILMLNCEEIDILWTSKDQFPKNFRTEVLFSEMDSSCSLVRTDLPCTEEKGLPVEAFAKVNEMFNNVDWLDPKMDLALSIIKKINILQDKLDYVSPRSAKNISLLQEPGLKEVIETPKVEMLQQTNVLPEKLESGPFQCVKKNSMLCEPSPERVVQKTKVEELESFKSSPSMALGKLLIPSLKLSLDVNSPVKKIETQDMQVPLHRPTCSKIITQRTTHNPVSNLASYSNSPVPISRYRGSSSTLGITALLHDHKEFGNEEVTHYVTVSSASAVSDLFFHSSNSSQPSNASIVEPPQSCLSLQTSPQVPATVTRTSAMPLHLSLSSPHLFSSGLPPPLSHQKSLTSVQSGELFLPCSPPQTPIASLSGAATSLSSTTSFSELHTPTPLPLLEVASSSSAKKLHYPPPRPRPPSFPTFSSGPVPSLNTKNSSSIPAPPPPPPPLIIKNSSSTLLPPPPIIAKNSLPTPPPPPPPPLGIACSLATGLVHSVVVPGSSLPSPPPPPPGPFALTLSPNIASLGPPPPPPLPPHIASKELLSRNSPPILPGPPPPPPPSGYCAQTTGASITSLGPPPPPPPTCIASKEYLSRNSPHIPPVLPPPAPSANGLPKAGCTPPHSAGSNGNIPPVPGPPFSMKGRSLHPSPRNQAQSKRTSLKPYHWLKLTRAVQGSLWAEAQKSDEASKAPEIDMSELETLFAATVPNSNDGSSGAKSNRHSAGSKSDKVNQIDLRRAYNCEIMLSKVKVPLPDLMSSVLALDDSALDADQVDNLIKFCPTKEEMELLKNYSGNKDKLGRCEQFFLELMKVPRVESKLRVFSFKILFDSQVSDLRKNLNTVNSVAEEIKNSVKLKRIMQTILSLGNALNHGTARGSAVGFRLDSLLKLTDTRARNNKMTLMHYLCKVLAEQLPELLNFPKDLVSLEASTKIQLKYLAEEMQAISKGLEKVVQELTASENDGPVSEDFCKNLKDFLAFAEAEVRSLALLYSGVGRNADALALYFGEDPARTPFEQVVSTLLNFVRMFVRAHEENEKQLDLEKKKAQKEVEKENKKTYAPQKEVENLTKKTRSPEKESENEKMKMSAQEEADSHQVK